MHLTFGGNPIGCHVLRRRVKHSRSKSYSQQPAHAEKGSSMNSEASITENANPRKIQQGPGSELQGLLLMAAVACMWGTSPVATRALYAQPGPPTPAALGTVQAGMAFLWLTLLNQFASHMPWALPASQTKDPEPTPHSSQALTRQSAQNESPANLEDVPQSGNGIQNELQQAHHEDEEELGLLQPNEQEDSADTSASESKSLLHFMRDAVAGILNRPASSQLAAGAELGAISAAANAATLIGFEDTLAARGSFLLRTSVMFTPILAALGGQQTPRAVWLGAGTAFVGGLLIAGDDLSSQGQHSSSLISLSGGDLMLIIAALLWAVQVSGLGPLSVM